MLVGLGTIDATAVLSKYGDQILELIGNIAKKKEKL